MQDNQDPNLKIGLLIASTAVSAAALAIPREFPGLIVAVCVAAAVFTLTVYRAEVMEIPKYSCRKWPWLPLTVLALQVIAPFVAVSTKAEDTRKSQSTNSTQPSIDSPGQSGGSNNNTISSGQSGGQTGGTINNYGPNNSNLTGGCIATGPGSSACNNYGDQRFRYDPVIAENLRKELFKDDFCGNVLFIGVGGESDVNVARSYEEYLSRKGYLTYFTSVDVDIDAKQGLNVIRSEKQGWKCTVIVKASQ